jgi:hypothetical protein
LLTKRNRQNTDTVAQNRKFPTGKEWRQMLLTFAFVTFAWIFFRADTLPDALGYIKAALSNWSALGNITGKSILVLGTLLIVIDWYLRHNERQLRVPKQSAIRLGIYFVMAIAVLLRLGGQQSFIYFQF